jgi:putative transposase
MEKLGRRFSWASLPLVATIARLLCKELTLQVEYLRTEVEVLRSRVPGRMRFTDEERRSLVDAALAMGRDAMRAVVSIVKPDTILDWHRKRVQAKWDYSKRRRRGPGRPRKPGEVEELVCRLARENAWGYRRISGELAKQGIAISKSCIADILRRHGLPPSPERTGLTWREFLRNEHRPHQGIGNRIPAHVHAGEGIPVTTDSPVGEVECEEFLGGLLKSYHRTAA